MSQGKRERGRELARKYPPSPACGCAVCLRYCMRPGWWTVEEAAGAMRGGYGGRMMLEIAPEHAFGVLSPAFRGCERGFALQRFASRGCNFLRENLCELHGTGFQPLECRFCHHERPGMGTCCHADIEQDWRTAAGKKLVRRWTQTFGLDAELERCGLLRIVAG